jgi:hypothetical protein
MIEDQGSSEKYGCLFRLVNIPPSYTGTQIKNPKFLSGLYSSLKIQEKSKIHYFRIRHNN